MRPPEPGSEGFLARVERRLPLRLGIDLRQWGDDPFVARGLLKLEVGLTEGERAEAAYEEGSALEPDEIPDGEAREVVLLHGFWIVRGRAGHDP